MKTATPRIAVAGLRSKGIYSYKPDVLPETTFAPSSVSERPLHYNVNRGKGIPSGTTSQELSATQKEAAVASSTPVGRSFQQIMSSRNVGRNLTLLDHLSILIRLW
jgi:hypothetical protein